MFAGKVPFYYYLKSAAFSADGLLKSVRAYHTTRDVMSFTPLEEFGREKYLAMVEYGHHFISRLPSGEIVETVLVSDQQGECFVVKGRSWVRIGF